VSVSGIKFFAVLKAYDLWGYKANTTPASPKAKKHDQKKKKKSFNPKFSNKHSTKPQKTHIGGANNCVKLKPALNVGEQNFYTMKTLEKSYA